MQILLGQAASGHASDSDLIPICQGGGKNGKTTLFTGARQALGDYHSLVSDKVLLGNPNDHPTELMDLRGARFALVEETPEEGKLDVQRVKKITGSGELTARYIRGNDVTFPITHTLFVTTNHKPLVNQTDFGTWRRLALIRFPYTFNGPKADPNLRDRIKRNPAVHRAALAWIVEGARRWYQLDRVTPPPPVAVAADTLEWRTESDSVLAYWIDRLVPDPGSHIASLDLLADFNDWLETRGHRKWSDKTLVERLGDHELADKHHVDRRRIRREQAAVGALDRPHAYAAPTPLGTQYQAWLGLRFRTPTTPLTWTEPLMCRVCSHFLFPSRESFLARKPKTACTPCTRSFSSISLSSFGLLRPASMARPRPEPGFLVPFMPPRPGTPGSGNVNGSREGGALVGWGCPFPHIRSRRR
jgi:putative DNA primase/helicase